MDKPTLQINLYRLEVLGVVVAAAVVAVGVSLLFKGPRLWFKRRYHELDLLLVYLRLVGLQWQALLWGGSVLALAFGWHFVTADWPYPVKVAACVTALFFAGYYLWRANHLRLQPKLRAWAFTRTTPAYGRMLYDKSSMPTAKGDSTACYLEVESTGEAVTVKDVRVQIAEMQPPVSSLALLPVCLRQRGDNVMKGVPPAQSFDLHAGERKIIELVSALTGAHQFIVEHIAWDTPKEIPPGRYRINVNISAENAPTLSPWFTVWMDEAGELQCKME